MKAIVYRRYGSPDVLHIEEMEKPEPGDGEVLIKVRAAAINPLDWHFIKGKPYALRLMSGLRKPKFPCPGVDVAGVVERTGRNVTAFNAGDEVFGVCRGSLAEFACASTAKLASKPANATFEEAASVPVAGCTALQAIRDRGNIRPGQRVLINGAAGGVGTFTVQIARSLGAHVTGVCSARNVDMVRSIGAHEVVDYTKADFTEAAQPYDVIVDMIGNRPLAALMRILQPRGTYVPIGMADEDWVPFVLRFARMGMLSLSGSRKIAIKMARVTAEDLATLRDMISAGKVTPVIDRRYTLPETPEAIRHLQTGHARGKIVVTMEQ